MAERPAQLRDDRVQVRVAGVGNGVAPDRLRELAPVAAAMPVEGQIPEQQPRLTPAQAGLDPPPFALDHERPAQLDPLWPYRRQGHSNILATVVATSCQRRSRRPDGGRDGQDDPMRVRLRGSRRQRRRRDHGDPSTHEHRPSRPPGGGRARGPARLDPGGVADPWRCTMTITRQRPSAPVEPDRDEVLVEPSRLLEHLGDPRLRVVEVDVAPAAYDAGHIDGAVLWNAYADLKDGDYATVDAAGFERLLRRSGITPDMTVVCFGYAAALGFWLLRRFGHSDVRILDASREDWLAAGGSLVPPPPPPPPPGAAPRAGGAPPPGRRQRAPPPGDAPGLPLPPPPAGG